MEQIFNSLKKEYNEPESMGREEDIVKKIEEEYLGIQSLTDVEKDRQNEIQNIQDKIKKLKNKLKHYKNIRNHKMVEVNKKRAEKRREIQNQIKIHEMRLNEIQMEVSQKSTN